MILPNNNISIMDVRNILGYPSMDLGTLCRCDNINKYSRFRPGYWSTGTSQNLIFNKPTGGSYNDPRGTDASGISVQAYKLGDFRGYDSTAREPFVNGQNPREYLVPFNHSGNTVIDEVVFDLGEVDWFGEELNYWGRNTITGFNQIIAVDVSNASSPKVLGYCNKADLISESGTNRKRAEFNVSLSVPSSSVTNVVKIHFALGSANKPYYYFPDIELIINVKKVSNPQYLIYATTEGLRNLYTKVASSLTSLDTNVYDIQLMPTSGTLNAGATTLSYTTTDTVLVSYPSYNQYRVTAPRWTVYYTVKVINQNTGLQINSWTDSGTWVVNGTGRYNVSIPLNTTAQDNYLYRVELTNFGSTTIAPI